MKSFKFFFCIKKKNFYDRIGIFSMIGDSDEKPFRGITYGLLLGI